MVEGEGRSYALFGHQDKAGRVDCGELVKILALEKSPRFLHIGGSAIEYAQTVQVFQRILPGERHIPSRVPFEKRERFKHDRHGSVKVRSLLRELFPSLDRSRMERVTGHGQCDPCAAVYEYGLAVLHQR